MNETNENVSSDETLQTQDKPVEDSEQTEDTAVRSKKTVTFSDTITIQAILCVAAAIAFAAVNIFDSGLAYDVYEIYSEKSSAQENISDTFKVLLDLLRSTPLS